MVFTRVFVRLQICSNLRVSTFHCQGIGYSPLFGKLFQQMVNVRIKNKVEPQVILTNNFPSLVETSILSLTTSTLHDLKKPGLGSLHFSQITISFLTLCSVLKLGSQFHNLLHFSDIPKNNLNCKCILIF